MLNVARRVRHISGLLEAVVGGHDARMRKAAMLGKENGPAVQDLYSRITSENVWVGMYGVVAAMAGRKSDVLQRIVLESPSWVLKARSIQSLSKIDQRGLEHLLYHPDTPLQAKHLIVRNLKVCSAKLIETLLVEPPLGGASAALLLLQKAPKSGPTEALVRQYLPRLSSLNARLPSTKLDLVSVYQSMAVRYPLLMLQLLADQTHFNARWFRASRELAASHPDELLAVLKKHAGNRHAVWFIARPLVRHRPLEVLETFVAVSAAFIWCLRKQRRNALYRRRALELARTLPVPKEKEREELVKLLLKILARNTEVKVIPDVVCRLVEEEGWEGRVSRVESFLNTKVKRALFRPSDAAAYSLVRRDMDNGILQTRYTPGCTVEAFKDAAARYIADPANSEAIERIVLDKCWDAEGVVPWETVTRTMQAAVVREDPRAKLELCDIQFAEARIKKLVDDPRSWKRQEALTSLWECVCHTVKHSGRRDRMLPVMQWIVSRLSKEKGEVKSEVATSLVGGDVALYGEDCLPGLEELLGYSLKWGEGEWVEGWRVWCSRIITTHLRSGTSDKLVVFADQALKRMVLAEVLEPSAVVSALTDAFSKLEVNEQEGLCPYVLYYLEQDSGLRLTTAEDVPAAENHAGKHQTTKERIAIKDLEKLMRVLDLLGGKGAGMRWLTACEPLSAFAHRFLCTRFTQQIAHEYLSRDCTLPRAQDTVWAPWEDATCAALGYLRSALDNDDTPSTQDPLAFRLFVRTTGRSPTAEVQCMIRDVVSLLGRLESRLQGTDVCAEIRKALLAREMRVLRHCGEVLVALAGWLAKHGHCMMTSGAEEKWLATMAGVYVAHVEADPMFTRYAKALVDVAAEFDRIGKQACCVGAILRCIGYPTAGTREVFEHAWGAINLADLPISVTTASLFRYSETQSAVEHRLKGKYTLSLGLKSTRWFVDDSTMMFRVEELFTEKLKGWRFRFQRGRRADARRSRIRDLRMLTKQRHAAAETWAADAIAQACSRITREDCIARIISGLVQHKRNITDCARIVVHRLILRSDAIGAHRTMFTLPVDLPEIADYMSKNATPHVCDEAVRELLKPHHTRRRRGLDILTNGLKNIGPSEVFRLSPVFQYFVFRYHPEAVPSLLHQGNSAMRLDGIVNAVHESRFGGLTTQCASFLYTLPPNVQQHLWDTWITPHAFEVSLEEAGGGTLGTSRGGPVHEAKARRIWVGAALSSPGSLPAVCDAGHPFNRFLERTVAERARARMVTEEEKANVKKSAQLDKMLLEGARAAQLALEVLLALRTFDRAGDALRVLVEHVDRGVSSKVAIPSVACALRCVPPSVAEAVLREVLSREETKTSARTQLGRCCVKLLPQDVVEGFVEAGLREGAESTKAALLCALVTTPLLRTSPRLWGMMRAVAENGNEENTRIMGSVLLSISGRHPVTTLNTFSWLAAPPGLAAMVASFVKTESDDYAVWALKQYFYSISDGLHVFPEDVEGVVAHAVKSWEVQLLRLMVNILTPHRPGLLAEVCKVKQDEMDKLYSAGDKYVSTASFRLRELCGDEWLGVSPQECKEAVEVLAGSPWTVAHAFVVALKQLDKDAGLDHALRVAAGLLDRLGPACLPDLADVAVYRGVRTETLPALLQNYMLHPDTLSPSLKFVTLALMKGMQIDGLTGTTADFVKVMAADSSPLVKAAAYRLLMVSRWFDSLCRY